MGWVYNSDAKVLASNVQGPGFDPQHYITQAWWHMLVFSTLRRYSQEDQKFKVILRYIATLRPAWAT